jgi:hypothetical protein
MTKLINVFGIVLALASIFGALNVSRELNSALKLNRMPAIVARK